MLKSHWALPQMCVGTSRTCREVLPPGSSLHKGSTEQLPLHYPQASSTREARFLNHFTMFNFSFLFDYIYICNCKEIIICIFVFIFMEHSEIKFLLFPFHRLWSLNLYFDWHIILKRLPLLKCLSSFIEVLLTERLPLVLRNRKPLSKDATLWLVFQLGERRVSGAFVW